MTDSYVQVAADSSGKKIDNEALTVAGSSVYRQRVRLAGLNPSDLANVTTSGGLDVSVTGGSVTISSISSATVYQGTTPWSVLASTSGGSQPVSIATLPLLISASTTGGNAPVVLQNTLPLSVVASTTGGTIPVATHAVTQGTIPWTVLASTSGGAQPVAQSSTPWVVVASTTGGTVNVFQVPGVGEVVARLMSAKDRLRTKNWNSIAQLQYKLVAKILRRGSDGWTFHTCTKIVSPSTDRGALPATFGASWPFGAASTFGTRTVTDAVVTSGSSTITSATAAFTSSDIGISVTILRAATAAVKSTSFGNTPDGTYNGNIVSASSGTPTTAQVYPSPTASTSAGTLSIDPPMLSDDDGVELGDCILVGVDANYYFSPTLIRRGQTFIEGETLKGPFNLDQGVTLFRGYLCTSNHLAWPNGPIEHMIEGDALVQTQVVSAPAVGTDWSLTVPTNARWQILEVSAVLSASSGASARAVALISDDPVNVTSIVLAPSGVAQTSGVAVRYNAAAGIQSDFITPAAGTQQAYIALSSPGPILSAGHRIRSATANIQAGDQWSSIAVRYKEWLEG